MNKASNMKKLRLRQPSNFTPFAIAEFNFFVEVKDHVCSYQFLQLPVFRAKKNPVFHFSYFTEVVLVSVSPLIEYKT